MSRFENLTTGAVFSVDDSKDHRYAGDGYRHLGDTPDAPDTGGPVPYADQKNDDLRDEITRRNEGRDDDALLSLEGNKADLVATLEADDASAE